MQMVWCLKCIVQSQNVGVIQLPHNLRFGNSVPDLVVCDHKLLVDWFHSIKLSRCYVLNAMNFTKWTFTQFFQHFKMWKFCRNFLESWSRLTGYNRQKITTASLLIIINIFTLVMLFQRLVFELAFIFYLLQSFSFFNYFLFVQ